MCGKLLTGLIILIAVILAVLASVLPPEQLDYVIGISKFFDIMLPILAVGALLKYLCKCQKCCSCKKTECSTSSSSCSDKASL
jgi:hypothetical protein